MNTLKTMLVLCAANLGLASGACEPEPPKPWQKLLAPRLLDEFPCDLLESQHDCVARRWEVFREHLKGTQPDYESALALCKLGACEPENIGGGPWVAACEELWLESPHVYNGIVRSCSCARGPLIDSLVAYAAMVDPPDSKRYTRWSRAGLLMEAFQLIEDLPRAMTRRGCEPYVRPEVTLAAKL